MIAVPAVDLKGGRCVQLVGGRPEDERVSLPNPVEVARSWQERGFESLHIVDLDAALGSGDNLELVRSVLDGSSAEAQVGGGVRSEERVNAVLNAGATRAVIGTRALDDPDWFATLAGRHPGRVTIALDTRDGFVLRKGWTERTALRVEEYLPTLSNLPLAGVLSTDVGREGRLEGIDLAGCQRVIDASPFPVWVSGGVTTVDELAALEAAGAAAAVLGMALYTNTMNPDDIAARWGTLGTSGVSHRGEEQT